LHINVLIFTSLVFCVVCTYANIVKHILKKYINNTVRGYNFFRINRVHYSIFQLQILIITTNNLAKHSSWQVYSTRFGTASPFLWIMIKQI